MQIRRVFGPLVWLLSTIAFCAQTDSSRLKLRSFDFSTHPSQNQCSGTHCLNLSEIIDRTLNHNLTTKEKAESLYIARQNIGEKMGALIPLASVGGAINTLSGDFFEVVPSLVGFLYPSHWYNWKKARRYANSERISYLNLVANQIHISQSLYYNIHLIMVNIDILEHYKKLINEVITTIQNQIDQYKRPITTEDLGIIQDIKARIKVQKEELKFSLDDMRSQVGHALYLQENWEQIIFEKMPNFINDEVVKEKEIKDYLPKIWDESLELQNIDELIEAAKYSRKSRKFDFLQSESKNSPLGLSYYKRLNIAKSEIRKLEIQYLQTRSQLKLSLNKSIYSYNNSFSVQKHLKSSKEALKGSAEALITNIYQLDQTFDLEKALRFFEFSMQTDLKLNTARHQYLISEAKINRLTLSGEFYNNISKHLPEEAKKKKKWWKF